MEKSLVWETVGPTLCALEEKVWLGLQGGLHLGVEAQHNVGLIPVETQEEVLETEAHVEDSLANIG